MSASQRLIKSQILAIYDECFAHDGYASFRVEMRILRRGQKEVIVDCGKQHRYVVDFQAGAPVAETGAT